MHIASAMTAPLLMIGRATGREQEVVFSRVEIDRICTIGVRNPVSNE
jgi:hypothetical protein